MVFSVSHNGNLFLTLKFTNKQTNSQVLIKIHDLSMDYWKPYILYDIVKGVEEPLKIDERNLIKELGFFC